MLPFPPSTQHFLLPSGSAEQDLLGTHQVGAMQHSPSMGDTLTAGGNPLKQPAGCWFGVFNDFWCFDWCNPRKTPDEEKVWPSKVAHRSPSKPWECSAALVHPLATRLDEAPGFGCGDLFFPKFPVITCIKTLQSHLIAFCGGDDMKLVSLLIFS